MDHYNNIIFAPQIITHSRQTYVNNRTTFPSIKRSFLPAILSDTYSNAFSRSAAHKEAPTVLVNEKMMEANGIISRAKAAMPSLHIGQHWKTNIKRLTYPVYAPRFLATHSSRCTESHPLSWKYRACSPGPTLLPWTAMYSTVPTTGIIFRGK